jgi:hypothetical protein
MKHPAVLLFSILIASATYAQQKAVTETGEDVFLYDDGTWKYAQEKAEEPTDIPVNPRAFQKDPNSKLLLKSTKVGVGIWLDATKWTFKKATSNEDAEFEFQMNDSDLYGMLITEKFEIPLATLRNIALENGRAVAPDLRIVKEEYRTVNGLRVLLLQMEGTMQGIKIAYYGYYYSSAEGTVQFITYTSQTLLTEYLPSSEVLLNGFSKLD